MQTKIIFESCSPMRTFSSIMGHVMRSRFTAKFKSGSLKSILSMTLALTFGLVGALAFVPSAKAATVVDVSAVELDFSSSKRTATSTPTALNGTSTYTNVATVGGVQIDAVVTTVALQNSSIDVYDSPGSASANEKYFQIVHLAPRIGILSLPMYQKQFIVKNRIELP
jgi:hypothetical protein